MFSSYLLFSQVPQLMAAATPSNEEKMFLWPETFSEYKPETIKEDEIVR